MIKKKGVPFFIELNSHQKYFGATGFVTKIANLTTGAVSTLPNDASEIIEPIETPATAVVDQAAEKDARQITIQSGHTFKDGMVFKDEHNNMYYISKVDGNMLRLKFPLKEGISYGSTLTQVGNTGVYKIEVLINEVGNFGVYISNPSIGLRTKGLQYTISDIVLEDVAKSVEDNFTAVNAKLDALEDTVRKMGSTAFTVVG